MQMVRGRLSDWASQNQSRERKNGSSGWTSNPGNTTLMRDQISVIGYAEFHQWRHTRVKNRDGLAKFSDMVVVPNEKILGKSGPSLTTSKNIIRRSSTDS
jgi:hypothetical protein